MHRYKKIFCVAIITILLFTVSASNARVSIGELRSVYHTLSKVSGSSLPLYLGASKKLDAYTNKRSVHITMGMLRFLKNKHELALVLAHELSHKYTANESAADVLGARLASRAGYNICLARENMLRFSKIENGEDGKHRSWFKRYHSLDKYCR